MKINQINHVTTLLATALVVVASTASLSYAAGGVKPDTSSCNTPLSIGQWDATFPDGTIKLGRNPNFVVNGSSQCASQFTGRIVSVTTGTYAASDGSTASIAPRREVSKDMTIKPGAFSLSVRLNDVAVGQVTQMRTEMTLYHSASFDANGILLSGAQPLTAPDPALWTQTNFQTF